MVVARRIQERLFVRFLLYDPPVPHNHITLRLLCIVEQPNQDHPIGHVREGTPAGETFERVPTRVGPEGEAQLPYRTTKGDVEWSAAEVTNREQSWLQVCGRMQQLQTHMVASTRPNQKVAGMYGYNSAAECAVPYTAFVHIQCGFICLGSKSDDDSRNCFG